MNRHQIPQRKANGLRPAIRAIAQFARSTRVVVLTLLFALSFGAAAPALAATGLAPSSDGTVLDQATGLTWKRCAEGQTWTGSSCSGTPAPYTWSQADALTGSVSFAGMSDWRLPSLLDLQTIVDMTASNPAINTTAFPNAPSAVFWSDTADGNNANNAMYVNFTYGNSSTLDKTSTFLVRLVRGSANTAGGGTTGGAGTLSIVPSLASGWNLLGNSVSPALIVATLYGDPNVINSVWKWDTSVPGWQFYAPSLTTAALQTYATSNGYGVLTTVNPGEGYWVNAKTKTTLATQTGAPFSLTTSNLVTGWNLVATSDNVGPSELNRRLSTTPPTPGVTPINFTTLWAWDNATSNWYFYAPSLEADGTLASYIASKSYLDFAQAGKTLGNDTGFWINRSASVVAATPSLTVGLSDSAGASVTSISSASPATVKATVRDASGVGIANAIVNFSADAKYGTIAPATALTNAAGIATATISAAGSAGASTVTASALVGTATVTGSINYTAASVPAGSLNVSLTDNSGAALTSLTNGTPATLSATLKDAAGTAVSDAIVTFNTEAIFATIAPTTALTNAAGVATAAINPSGNAGASIITASAQVGTATVTGLRSYTVTTVAAPSVAVTLTDSAGARVTTISSAAPATVNAKVTDASGNAVPNAIVSFSTDATFATIAPTTALTNTAGLASVAISAVGNAGASTVFATTQVASVTGTGSVRYTAATAATPTLSVALTDSAGVSVTNISSGSPATVKATVKDAAGVAVAGAIVSFSTDSTFGTIAPVSATALTDATGVASVTLSAASLTSAGASTITASSQVGSAAIKGSKGYSVGAAAVTITAPAFALNPLSAYGTTSVSVTVSVNGIAVTTPQTVTFTSSCASNGKAVLTSSVATVNGVASASYRDNGCASDDIVTASVSGIASAATTLTINPPSIGSIQFVSATPSRLSLKGIGGTEASLVTFKLLDNSGNPLGGRTVDFALNTGVGGVALTSTSGISDTDGLAVVRVNSGKVSIPVRVTASIAGTALTSQSSMLTISTGIPDQDSFSLAASKLNPEAWQIDGATTVISARLADHFNNPVPDGTVVNFTTDGGSIVASCSTVTDSNGNSGCSATLTSQAPRPTNGRVHILAYAQGEESFTDLNGNGVADAGEFTDLPEAFRDDNEDGVHNANETFIDFNGDGKYNGSGGVPFVSPDTGDGKYSGVLCDSSAASNICSGSKTLLVFKQIVIVFSGSDPYVSKISPATIDLVGGCSGTLREVDLRIVDVNGNPLPAGTTIGVTTTDGTIAGTSSFVQANTNKAPAAGAANYTVFVRDDSANVTTVNTVTGVSTTTCKDSTPSGVLTVTVTTPGGVVKIAEYPVSN